jgi:hypothetical protein
VLLAKTTTRLFLIVICWGFLKLVYQRKPPSYDGVFSERYHRLLPKVCHRCSVPFREGDGIHVQSRSAAYSGKHVYHLKCFEEMFI